MDKFKHLFLLLSLVMAVGCVYFLIDFSKSDSGMVSELNSVQAEINVLKKKERALKSEQEDVKNLLNINDDTSVTASLVLCFEPSSSRVYEEVYPLMKDSGYSGILVFTSGALPGNSKYMKKEQAVEMVESGWEIAVGAGPSVKITEDKEKDCQNLKKNLEKYLDNMEKRLGVRPGIVIFDKSYFRDGFEQVVEDIGVKLYINYDGADAEVNNCYQVVEAGYLKQAVEGTANLTHMALYYNLDADEYAPETYSEMNLTDTLCLLSEYETARRLVVAEPHVLSENPTIKSNTADDLKARLKEIEKELSAVQKQIRALYD